MLKGTTMIGQATGLIPPPTTNPLAIRPPTPPNLLEFVRKTERKSGAETTATDGITPQRANPPSLYFCFCLCPSLSLSPPCGDSWLSQHVRLNVFLSPWSLKHIIKKKQKISSTSRDEGNQANLAIDLLKAQNETDIFLLPTSQKRRRIKTNI